MRHARTSTYDEQHRWGGVREEREKERGNVMKKRKVFPKNQDLKRND